MTNKIKWLINDLGLNELNAWLWITGGAALTAAVLVLLTGGGAECIPILESVLPEYLMKKLIILLGLPLIFNTVYAQHTHNNVKLTRETKIIAITILAEARGEGHGGMYAVAAVIAQRAFERKRTPTEICLKPYQFSCWNGKKLKRP